MTLILPQKVGVASEFQRFGLRAVLLVKSGEQVGEGHVAWW